MCLRPLNPPAYPEIANSRCRQQIRLYERSRGAWATVEVGEKTLPSTGRDIGRSYKTDKKHDVQMPRPWSGRKSSPAALAHRRVVIILYYIITTTGAGICRRNSCCGCGKYQALGDRTHCNNIIHI